MYALGCVAWSLLCGPPPFHRDSVEEVLQAHLTEPVPTFEPKKPVPPGVEGWIQQLLHKSPHHRYVRAADAIHALQNMAPSDEVDTLHIEPVFKADLPGNGPDRYANEATSAADDTQVMAPRTISGRQSVPAPLPQVEKSLLWADRGETPPMPADWQTDQPYRSVPHLLGTGLAMFGMRSFPLVGREPEQETLWTSLATVRSTQSTRIVLVEGADGMGKSHLAGWIARRSYEVGTAITVRAQFQADDNNDPLVDLVHALLGTTGLSRSEAKQRVEQALGILGRYDADEIETILAVLGPFQGEQFTEKAQQERNEFRIPVIRRIIHRFSVLRPIVVVLDDAHLNEDALEFTRALLAASPVNHPILCVFCVNTVSLDEDLKKQLIALKKRKAVDTISLRPLAKEHRSTLVRRLLGLAPNLAALVERRCGGNPQFAIQLVGDWIQKDILTQSPDGFTIKEGVRPDFPADLQAVWERRLTAALPATDDTQCLQVAAELGMEVSREEWQKTCEILNIPADASMINALVDAHLLIPKAHRKGWAFVHSLVQETLKRQAEFSGVRQEHHKAVATMLEGREGVANRLGRHLFHAGELEASIGSLLDGAWQSLRDSRIEQAWDLLMLREKALHSLSIPEHDLRWSEGWMAKERFFSSRKLFPAVLEVVDLILEKTKQTPNAENIRAMALFRRGSIQRLMAKTAEARETLKSALKVGPNNAEVTWQVLEQLGSLELMYGDPQLAATHFEGALAAAEQTGVQDHAFRVRQNMAGVYRRNGDTAKAHSNLSACLKYYQHTGSKRLQSRCLNDLAEIDRFTGNLEQAEEGYRQALSLLEALGDQAFYVSALNLGAIYTETGRPVEARNQLEQCISALKGGKLRGLEGAANLFLAHAHVQLGLMDEWRRAFDIGIELVTETGMSDVDIARCTTLGGKELLAHGYPSEAIESLTFSLKHWRLLEREQEINEVDQLIKELTARNG